MSHTIKRSKSRSYHSIDDFSLLNDKKALSVDTNSDYQNIHSMSRIYVLIDDYSHLDSKVFFNH